MKTLLLLLIIAGCSKSENKAPEIKPLFRKAERVNESPAEVKQPSTEIRPERPRPVEPVKQVELPRMEGHKAPSNASKAVQIDTKPGDPAVLPQMGGEESKLIEDPEVLPPSRPGEAPILPRSGK
ncbi:hypothetical protein [Peredibacter starrii]|uniref:Uncharacterized protein n=1 Tax=Peredibacter starrii TaxID=28202 RepID=A0AAX4HNV6_9BACT|nr:hypothetical protein [Peredibacter starrii]WPU64942.1 hypothetical protein SOO65_19795 [Peredibacter starrii]